MIEVDERLVVENQPVVAVVVGKGVGHDVERRHHALGMRLAGQRVGTHLLALLVVSELAVHRFQLVSDATTDVTLRPMPR